jgi:hypothetical protein
MGYTIAKYIRLSIDDAKTESMSIENQRLFLDSFIASMDETDTGSVHGSGISTSEARYKIKFSAVAAGIP